MNEMGQEIARRNVDEVRLRATTDANVWAEEFCNGPAARILIGIDDASKDLMRSWFANAIETTKILENAGLVKIQGVEVIKSYQVDCELCGWHTRPSEDKDWAIRRAESHRHQCVR